ncbi:hypothetical protein ACQ4PT_046858 [Festuca glaucescens]
MASMMGGDFVEAYVLRNAYKEKMRRMDEAAAAAAVEGKNSKEGGAGGDSAGEKKAESASSKQGRRISIRSTDMSQVDVLFPVRLG